jgi:predicted MFS family arabinose efflux permease
LLAKGTTPAVMASTADMFAGSARVRAYGWVNGGFAFAALLGVPLLALVAGVTHWRVSFAVVGGALMALTLVLWRMRFPQPTGRAGGYASAYAALLRRPAVWFISLSNLCERILFGAAITYLPSFLVQRYDLALGATAPILMLTAMGGLVGNLVAGCTSAGLPAAKVFGVCQALAGLVAVVVLGLDWPLVVAAALMWLLSAANTYSRPPFLALVTEVGAMARGRMLGLLSVTNQGGATAGAALGGLIFALGGYPAVGALIAVVGLATLLAAARAGELRAGRCALVARRGRRRVGGG